MARLRFRLNRLETAHRADPPDPHALCGRLFQTRIVALGPRDAWGPDVQLPEQRPLDSHLYPPLECFFGPDCDCPHNSWADLSDRQLHEFASYNFGREELGETGPEPTPEEMKRQREGVAAYRGRAATDLPKLERKLNRMKEGTRHV